MINQKTTPTDSQVDLLMSDWLGNLRMHEEGNYTHRGKGGIKTRDHTKIREFMLGNLSGLETVDAIRESRIAAEKIVSVVAPDPLKLMVGGETSFHAKTSDGTELINLATDYFDDTRLTNGEKADIMLGLACHEAAHAAYTDNSMTDIALQSEDPELQTLKKEIWNIIEDERIEYHLGEDRPGLTECLGASKGYYFDRLVKDMTKDGKMPTEPVPRLLNAITQAIRYPSQMTREQVIQDFDALDAVRRALTPYPISPEAAWEATDRVMDIIRETAKDELKKQQENQVQGQSGSQSQGNGQGNPSSGGQPQSRTQENQQPDNSQQQQQQPQSQSGAQDQQPSQKQEQSSTGGETKKKKEPTKKQVNEALKRALNTEEGKKVMQAISRDNDKNGNNSTSDELSVKEDKEYANDNTAEKAQGSGPGKPNTYIFKPKGDARKYASIRQEVQAYVQAMSRALRCRSQEQDYVLRGQPTGKLDTSKLVSYKLGNEKIFRKYGSVTCNKASICMLIDESGSMHGRLQQEARRAAILVNEAVKRIHNVEFFCYGYTSRKMNVYCENNKISPWALSATEATNGTPTGEAMKNASERIRRYTKDPVLMLVLTDGHPHDTELVMKMDRELPKSKIYPVGVGILTNAVRGHFKEAIVMNDISTFALDLGRLTRGKLDKMLVKSDSRA